MREVIFHHPCKLKYFYHDRGRFMAMMAIAGPLFQHPAGGGFLYDRSNHPKCRLVRGSLRGDQVPGRAQRDSGRFQPCSRLPPGFGLFLIFMGILHFFSNNFIGGMWCFLIDMFLHSAAKVSYCQILLRKTLQGEPVGHFMKKDPVTVPPSTTMVEEIVEDLNSPR